MMYNNENPTGLRPAGIYILKSLKFYGLKSEYLVSIIFIINLAVHFMSILVLNYKGVPVVLYFAVQFIRDMLTGIMTSAYLLACIKEFKNENYNGRECFMTARHNMIKIAVISLVYSALLNGSLYFQSYIIFQRITFFILPVVIYLHIMFIFNLCAIVDRNESIIQSFKSSKTLTDRRKWKIFVTVMLFGFLSSIILISVAGNNLTGIFIVTFLAVIIGLMQTRLIALMYTDLQYKDPQQI